MLNRGKLFCLYYYCILTMFYLVYYICVPFQLSLVKPFVVFTCEKCYINKLTSSYTTHKDELGGHRCVLYRFKIFVNRFKCCRQHREPVSAVQVIRVHFSQSRQSERSFYGHPTGVLQAPRHTCSPCVCAFEGGQ